MDVDDGAEEQEADGEDDPMDDSSQPRTPKPKKTKKKKRAPRKSELNMEALTQEQQALAALESDQLLHLRLKKRYYAEGLSFIRLVEEGMKVVEQLLASTNKAEVLESMEFFRVVFEYQFDGAEVGFRVIRLEVSLIPTFPDRDSKNASPDLVKGQLIHHGRRKGTQGYTISSS